MTHLARNMIEAARHQPQTGKIGIRGRNVMKGYWNRQDWSRKYGTQPVIQSYIDGCAQKYGVVRHVQFGKNPNHWPSLTFDYRRQVRYFDPVHYQADAAPQREPAPVP